MRITQKRLAEKCEHTKEVTGANIRISYRYNRPYIDFIGQNDCPKGDSITGTPSELYTALHTAERIVDHAKPCFVEVQKKTGKKWEHVNGLERDYKTVLTDILFAIRNSNTKVKIEKDYYDSHLWIITTTFDNGYRYIYTVKE